MSSRKGVLPAGWVLTELLTVMVLTIFFAGGLLQTVLSMQRMTSKWERSVSMRQSLSAALFLVCRDMRMAGCNPMHEADFQGVGLLDEGDPVHRGIQLRMDRRGKSPGSNPDGDAEDPDEDILYLWEEGESLLRRNGQPVAIRITGNPDGESVFFREQGPEGDLLQVSLTTGFQGESLSLYTSVHVRNDPSWVDPDIPRS